MQVQANSTTSKKRKNKDKNKVVKCKKCNRPAVADGLCWFHYMQSRNENFENWIVRK